MCLEVPDQLENRVKDLRNELCRNLVRAVENEPEAMEMFKMNSNNIGEIEVAIALVVSLALVKFLKEIYLKDFWYVMESPSMKGFYS